MLLEDLGVFLERLVGAHEHDADLRQLLADRVVDHLGVVLRADAGEELALRLGDAQLLEGRLDLLGDVVPRLLFALGRLAVVDDLVEVDAVETVGPVRHGTLDEVLVGAEAELEHPVRLVLEPADLLDGLARQPALGLAQVDDVVVERELVALVGDDLAGRGHRVSGLVSGGDAVAASRSRATRARVIPTSIIGITTRSVNEPVVPGTPTLARDPRLVVRVPS